MVTFARLQEFDTIKLRRRIILWKEKKNESFMKEISYNSMFLEILTPIQHMIENENYNK